MRWRDLPGFEGAYEVSEHGDVRSYRRGGAVNRGAPPKPVSGTLVRGYRHMHLAGPDGKRRHVSVHEAVLTSFVGDRPPGHQARHLNGDRGDNRLENLAWGTPKQNAEDMERHGTRASCEKHPKSKLTILDVAGVLSLIRRGHTRAFVARIYGVQPNAILGIEAGKNWRKAQRLIAEMESKNEKQ